MEVWGDGKEERNDGKGSDAFGLDFWMFCFEIMWTHTLIFSLWVEIFSNETNFRQYSNFQSYSYTKLLEEIIYEFICERKIRKKFFWDITFINWYFLRDIFKHFFIAVKKVNFTRNFVFATRKKHIWDRFFAIINHMRRQIVLALFFIHLFFIIVFFLWSGKFNVHYSYYLNFLKSATLCKIVDI